MIAFEKIYSLSQYGLHGELVVNAVDLPYERRLLLANGTWRPESTLRFVQHMGKRTTDFLSCGHTVVSLVSQRFRDVLSSNEFSGWAEFPVDIRLKDGTPVNGYLGLSITGRCGRIDNSKSKLVKRPPKIPGKVTEITAWLGLYFDPSTWDGSDLFMPEGTGYIFVTEPVKKALEQAELSNVHFTRLTEVERLVI